MTVISECVCLQVVFVSCIPHNSRRDWSIYFDFVALPINNITLHFLMLLVCFHFIVRQQQKLSSLFTQKTMEVEPEKHEDGLDKDDSEA